MCDFSLGFTYHAYMLPDIMGSAIVYSVIGFLLGGGLVGIFFWKTQKENIHLRAEINANQNALSQMDGQFKLTAAEAVKNAHESFLQLAKENFKQTQVDGAHDLDKRHKAIDEMVKPVHKQLEALSGALKQAQGTDQALRDDLKNLNKETSKLAGALRNPAARGNWGEEMLERLLENSGLIKGVHYTLQATLQSGERILRPDAVISLPDSLHIVIDSKAPINDFIRNLDEDLDESAYKELQTGLAMAVKSHIKDLSKKAYWEQLNSPDFVVLFLPSEHLFSAAVQADPTLLDLAAEKNIVLASPILTMSILRVVGMSWRQIDMAKNAAEISTAGAELYKRFLKFTDHFEKIGKNLSSAMRGYDDAVGSLERSVLPSARKFKELQGQASVMTDVPEMKTIEATPRAIKLSAEDETEKKRA